MAIKTEVYTLYAHWACALINGDDSGMEEEDINALEDFLLKSRKNGFSFYCLDCNDESEFKKPDCGGLPGDCLEYTFDVSPIPVIKINP